MLLWLVLGLWEFSAANWRGSSGNLILFLLLLILGWKNFGPHIHG
jgi:hypothetical protein